MCVHAWVLSCIWLFCEPMDCSPPGSSVHGIFQARILEWVAISPGDLPDPGIERAASLLLSQKVMLCRMCTYSQCCILLLAWPLYHCVALLSLITVLKSVYDIKRPSNPSFLLVSVCMDYLSFPFVFSLCMSSHLKWVSHRQYNGFFFKFIHSATLY